MAVDMVFADDVALVAAAAIWVADDQDTTVGRLYLQVLDPTTGAVDPSIAPLPGVTALTPGSCTLPLPGIMAAIVDETGHDVANGQGGILVIKRPWPAMIRTIWNDPERFRKGYYPEELGGTLYLAGDGSVDLPFDPVTAVLRINGQFFVFVAEPAAGGALTAKQRAIKVGPIAGEQQSSRSGSGVLEQVFLQHGQERRRDDEVCR